MLREIAYRLYERRLAAQLNPDRIPRHVGVVLDGNRRWAKAAGERTATGHKRGADKIQDLLGWCDDAGVEVVTLWLLSIDNFNRPPAELADLLVIIENAVSSLADTGRWRVNPVGALDMLPDTMVRTLKEARDRTAGNRGLIVNTAVGYGGQREIIDAMRSMLKSYAAKGVTIEDVATVLDIEDVAEHLYTSGQPDPDLLIRTSGEQRLGGFMLWQSAHSEFYFCDAYWPDFRHVDFLRALRAYASRNRRFGS